MVVIIGLFVGQVISQQQMICGQKCCTDGNINFKTYIVHILNLLKFFFTISNPYNFYDTYRLKKHTILLRIKFLVIFFLFFGAQHIITQINK